MKVVSCSAVNSNEVKNAEGIEREYHEESYIELEGLISC